MSPHHDSSVLLFVKYPAAGTVKTRLSQQVGAEFAAELYESFVLDLLTTLNNLGLSPTVFCEPADASEQLQKWLGKDYLYVPQTGRDLGEKMKRAFQHAFNEGFSKLVLIGSDLPDLPADFLNQAFHALDNHDVVLGPSSDGGYYLIGFTKDAFLPQAFDNIAWGQSTVFEHTMDILRHCRRRVFLLPRWHDVDTFEDLKSLFLRNKNTDFASSPTFALLKEQLGRNSYA